MCSFLAHNLACSFPAARSGPWLLVPEEQCRKLQTHSWNHSLAHTHPPLAETLTCAPKYLENPSGIRGHPESLRRFRQNWRRTQAVAHATPLAAQPSEISHPARPAIRLRAHGGSMGQHAVPAWNIAKQAVSC